MIEVTGKPSTSDLADIHSPLAMTMFESLNINKDRKKLSEIIVNADKVAIDFMQKLLVFNPTKRMTAN